MRPSRKSARHCLASSPTSTGVPRAARPDRTVTRGRPGGCAAHRRRAPARHRRSRSAARFTTTLLLFAACGRGVPDDAPAAGRDLLALGPDRIVEQVGRVRPGDEAWLGVQRSGWSPEPIRIGGRTAMWTSLPTARLDLPLVVLADRNVEVVVRAPAVAEESVEVTLVVNEIEIGSGAATPGKWTTLSFEAPRAMWHWGGNLFEIRVDRLTSIGTSNPKVPDKVGVAVAAVRYAEPRRVRRSRGSIRLPPKTALRWQITPGDHPVLELEGRASSAGALVVDFSGVTPFRGVSTELPEERFEIRLDGGSFRRLVRLPDEEVVEATLHWTSPQGAGDLELRRAGLHEMAVGPRPPVVLVSIDTLAARHLSIYGYPRETSPHLARLAEDAVVFESCTANAPWTLPSHLSMFTGLFAESHRRIGGEGEERGDRVWHWWSLGPSRWSLPEILRSVGYTTAGFVDVDWLTSRFQMHRGFDHFDDSAVEVTARDPEGGILHILPRLAKWLERRPRELPFFLFVHAFDVHGPYMPPRPWKGAFQGDGLGVGGVEVPAGTMLGLWGGVPVSLSEHLSEEMGRDPHGTLPLDAIVTAYDEEVAAIDAALGRLFDLLRDEGVYDESIIVVTADHGESLSPEHRHFGHSVVYESVTHVPLVVKLPASLHGGTRVPDLVQTVDVLPTILDHLDVSFDLEPGTLHGRSVLPAMAGEDLRARPVFSEGGEHRLASVQFDGWKLIEAFPDRSAPPSVLTNPNLPPGWLEERIPDVRGKRLSSTVWREVVEAHPEYRQIVAEARELLKGPIYELYHLPTDPGETRDLAAQKPEKVEELSRVLGFLKTLARSKRTDPFEPLEKVVFSTAELEELRALGYVGEE